jgi:hypothetical protein
MRLPWFLIQCNGALYNDFRKACNEEILITILGQTMTTQDGSSLAQGKVHMEVQEKKHRSDRRYTERALNKHFVPWLISRGFPVEGGRFHFRDKTKELSVDDVVKIVDMIDVPAAWIHETYNIPVAKEDETVARGSAAREVADVEYEEIKEGGKGGKAENSDKAWYERLRDFFVPALPSGGAADTPLPIRLNEGGGPWDGLIGKVWRERKEERILTLRSFTLSQRI